MRVSLPHKLTKAEVRQRLRSRAGELAGGVAGGMATVDTAWRDEDHLDLTITAMGQSMAGAITIEAQEVVVTLELPFALGFMESMIAGSIQDKGQKLLA